MGKTSSSQDKANEQKKHPHGRGEDLDQRCYPCVPLETPPRAWGRLSKLDPATYDAGNTPTGVGKTVLIVPILKAEKKHPHGRGEDCGQGRAVVK